MRNNLGKKPLIYPQPVLMIGTYGEDGTPDIMNAAWGAVGNDTEVFLCLSPEHKTVENLLKSGAFTVSIATEAYAAACDYLGIASGNDIPDKVERSGLHVTMSEFVNAPVIDELPLCLECTVTSYDPETCHLFGEIINTNADPSILTDGKIDPRKLSPLIFDIDCHNYYGLGDVVAAAFSVGAELMK